MAYLELMVEHNVERRRFLSLPFYYSILLDVHGTPHGASVEEIGTDLRKPFLSETLLDVLLSINGQQQQEQLHNRLDPRPVLQAVGQKHKQFQARYGAVTNADQQDAQELLQAALGMIIDEGQLELTPAAVPSTLVSSYLSSLSSLRRRRRHGNGSESSMTTTMP
jgi:hypothetical protein